MSATQANSAFSPSLPNGQWAWDSTSLGEAKTCLRKYQYSIVQGWRARAESVHLTFGIYIHQGCEVYDHARAKGKDHDESLDAVVNWCLRTTWDRELGRPWISDHPAKNRLSLLRTLVWYLDQFGASDPLRTVVLESGKPAVELSFRFEIGEGLTAEALVLCGHLDRIAELNGDNYILDHKTTLSGLTPNWFKQFNPHNQFSVYTLAGKVAFGVPVKGLIVDGMQIGAGFSRFQRAPVPRHQDQLEEFLVDAKYWIRLAQEAAIENYWPQNDKSCTMYGGCPFLEICARRPAERDAALRAGFVQKIWDPLRVRGDI